MTGLLSAISGQFTKAWILGALFPAAVFVVLYLVFVAPLLPPEFTLAAPGVFGTEWNALSVTFATIVLAGLLYNLDTALIKLYEGYPWKHTLLGKALIGLQKRRLARLRLRARVLFELAAEPGTPNADDVDDARGTALRALAEDFPDRDDLVLPTRLGNIMRAFERYPTTQYQMDAIYLWPRLIAVIEERYATPLGDARISLVFLLTLSFLNGVLGVMTVAAGLRYLPPAPVKDVVLPAAAFFLAAGWLYRESFGAARDWGELVKGAFDLYRWKLLDQLGFSQTPATRAGERDLWGSIVYQTVFGDEEVSRGEFRPFVEYADPTAPSTAAQVRPEGAPVELARGVENGARLHGQRVVVEVRNTGRRTAAVVVEETLPAGVAYRWNSARVDGRAVAVTGTGPYRFDIGNVAANESAVLTYEVCRIHNASGR